MTNLTGDPHREVRHIQREAGHTPALLALSPYCLVWAGDLKCHVTSGGADLARPEQRLTPAPLLGTVSLDAGAGF